jgi:hypothetical protein
VTGGLSEGTRHKVREILRKGRTPASLTAIRAFLDRADENVAAYLSNRVAQRHLPPAEVTRRQLAKVNSAAVRLGKELDALPTSAHMHIRQAFALVGGDVGPFIKGMCHLLAYAQPAGRGRKHDHSDFALGASLMMAYKQTLAATPRAGEDSRFTRVFAAICDDPCLGGFISNPRDVARSVLKSQGFSWLADGKD